MATHAHPIQAGHMEYFLIQMNVLNVVLSGWGKTIRHSEKPSKPPNYPVLLRATGAVLAHRHTNISFTQAALLMLSSPSLYWPCCPPIILHAFLHIPNAGFNPSVSWILGHEPWLCDNWMEKSWLVSRKMISVWCGLSWWARLPVEAVLGGIMVCDMAMAVRGTSGYWHLNH